MCASAQQTFNQRCKCTSQHVAVLKWMFEYLTGGKWMSYCNNGEKNTCDHRSSMKNLLRINAAICDSWLISCMSVDSIKHCTLIKIRPALHSPVQLMLTQAESVGGAYAQTQPIRARLPATTCMMKVPRRGSSCCTSNICSHSPVLCCFLSTVQRAACSGRCWAGSAAPCCCWRPAGGSCPRPRWRWKSCTDLSSATASPSTETCCWCIMTGTSRTGPCFTPGTCHDDGRCQALTSQRSYGRRHLLNSVLVWTQTLTFVFTLFCPAPFSCKRALHLHGDDNDVCHVIKTFFKRVTAPK